MQNTINIKNKRARFEYELQDKFTAGIVLSGADCLLDGGGWETLSNGGTTVIGIFISGARCIVQNISAQTTAGGGTGNNAVFFATDTDGVGTNIRAINSDNVGIRMAHQRGKLIGCLVVDADAEGITVTNKEAQITSCTILNAGTDGIGLVAGGSDSIIVTGCTVIAVGSNSIEIGASGEDNLIVANRLVNAVSDASGTSTVASNEVGAFT